MIAGSELKVGIHQAMAREAVLSIAELSRRSGVRRDTMYGWFRKARVNVSAGSIEKLVTVLGSAPGDPWYEEPTQRTLDPESLALLDAAVGRAMDRLGDRLVAFLNDRLPRSESEGAA